MSDQEMWLYMLNVCGLWVLTYWREIFLVLCLIVGILHGRHLMKKRDD